MLLKKRRETSLASLLERNVRDDLRLFLVFLREEQQQQQQQQQQSRLLHLFTKRFVYVVVNEIRMLQVDE